MRLAHHRASPILRPNPFNDWEALNVFNPVVVFHDGAADRVIGLATVPLSDALAWTIEADL